MTSRPKRNLPLVSYSDFPIDIQSLDDDGSSDDFQTPVDKKKKDKKIKRDSTQSSPKARDTLDKRDSSQSSTKSRHNLDNSPRLDEKSTKQSLQSNFKTQESLNVLPDPDESLIIVLELPNSKKNSDITAKKPTPEVSDTRPLDSTNESILQDEFLASDLTDIDDLVPEVKNKKPISIKIEKCLTNHSPVTSSLSMNKDINNLSLVESSDEVPKSPKRLPRVKENKNTIHSEAPLVSKAHSQDSSLITTKPTIEALQDKHQEADSTLRKMTSFSPDRKKKRSCHPSLVRTEPTMTTDTYNRTVTKKVTLVRSPKKSLPGISLVELLGGKNKRGPLPCSGLFHSTKAPPLHPSARNPNRRDR